MQLPPSWLGLRMGILTGLVSEKSPKGQDIHWKLVYLPCTACGDLLWWTASWWCCSEEWKRDKKWQKEIENIPILSFFIGRSTLDSRWMLYIDLRCNCTAHCASEEPPLSCGMVIFFCGCCCSTTELVLRFVAKNGFDWKMKFLLLLSHRVWSSSSWSRRYKCWT